MGFETLLGPIASIGGALIGSDSASSAADAQAAGTAQANALQQKQYEETKKLLAPFVGTGTAANNKLAQMLGLGGANSGNLTADQIRAQLLPKFTRTNTSTPAAYTGGIMSDHGDGGQWDPIRYPQANQGAQSGQTTVDEAGLQAAINAQLAGQPNIDTTAPDYGSLLKAFTPGDLQDDPGYKFGMDQGNQQIDRLNASRGSLLSGSALKALGRFNADYAGTKYNEAFNRDAAQKTQQFNFLSGTSGAGQNAAAGTGTAGQTMANQVGANTTANANAQGAASISQGNAWNTAFSDINSANQQNNLLKTLTAGNSSWQQPSFGSGWAANYEK
jgi:hypothetical protein